MTKRGPILLLLVATLTSSFWPKSECCLKSYSKVATDSSKTMTLLQGRWIHEKDKLAILTIRNDVWTFGYTGEEESAEDIYHIYLTDKLPQFAQDTVESGFIVLTNKSDTTYFEILGLTKKNLSLMHFPSGRLHLYKR